ncbi:hypothetical protein [Pelagibius marinus]|uniref:hypothetical protein n=1 Tax=Pelagibius marinus TaxID=2762760 RepID=UPI00187250F3|nr:hypothetical protein [Pelagibius marinus]
MRRASAKIFVILALMIQVVVGTTAAVHATAVVSDPDRVVEVTIAENTRETFLREIEIFADALAFSVNFSPAPSDPDQPFPLLWRNDCIIYVQPMPYDGAHRLMYRVSFYSRGFEPVSQRALDQLVQELGSAVGKVERAVFDISR